MKRIFIVLVLIFICLASSGIIFGYHYDPQIIDVEGSDAKFYNLNEIGNIYSLSNTSVNNRLLDSSLYKNNNVTGSIRILVPKTSIQIKTVSNEVIFFDNNFEYLIIDCSESKTYGIVAFQTANKKFFWLFEQHNAIELIFHGEMAVELEISGPDEHYVSMTDNHPESHFREQLKAYSNILGDVTESIILVNDTYSQHKNIPGVYYLEYKISDPNQIFVLFKVRIIVYDNISPTITDNSSHIRISNRDTFDIEHYLESLVVMDNVDSELRINLIEDTYTPNKLVPGMYHLVVEVLDKSNNVSVLIKPIEVVDSIKQLATIFVYSNQVLSTQQIIKEAFGNPYHVTILKNEYLNNEANPGNYLITFRDDGQLLYDYQVYIRVVSNNESKDINKNDSEDYLVIVIALIGISIIGLLIINKKRRTSM